MTDCLREHCFIISSKLLECVIPNNNRLEMLINAKMSNRCQIHKQLKCRILLLSLNLEVEVKNDNSNGNS